MTKPLKVYSSIGQAAASMGLSIDAIRAAKAKGCPAFRGSRVHKKDLMTWLARNSVSMAESVSLKDQELIERIRGRRLNNDFKAGLLVERKQVAATIAAIMSAADRDLEQQLTNEWPSLVAGMSIADARELGRRTADAIRHKLTALKEEWK